MRPNIVTEGSGLNWGNGGKAFLFLLHQWSLCVGPYTLFVFWLDTTLSLKYAFGPPPLFHGFKRNLKDMVIMGLTAKKEKDEKVQQMKIDVGELIKMRVPYIKSKVLEQQAGGPDDFQEMGDEEKEKIERKYGMDDAIEDKICDLYDLYVDGVDEEAGPQARKLYYEDAHLWPEGFMDNHGIKRAICRAKDRKRALYGRSKEEEKIKRKKLVQKTEGTVRVDSSTVSQPQRTEEKSVSQPSHHGPAEVITASPKTKHPGNFGNREA